MEMTRENNCQIVNKTLTMKEVHISKFSNKLKISLETYQTQTIVI